MQAIATHAGVAPFPPHLVGRLAKTNGHAIAGSDALDCELQLRLAAYYAPHVEALRALHELGCPMAARDHKGCNAAFMAAMFGHVEALRVLKEDLGCPVAAQPYWRSLRLACA